MTFNEIQNERFLKLLNQEKIYLYAGDVPNRPEYDMCIGLSLNYSDTVHIHHDITNFYPLPDNCVDIFQAEDVFEHIEFKKLPEVVNEIYRILKPGGFFRLSVPDYRCDILYNRTQKNEFGELQFDPEGCGEFKDGKVINGGHVWFPTYEIVKNLLDQSKFEKFSFYHYYNEFGVGIANKIDYSVAFVMRTPDHDKRVQTPYRPMSIVVDCFKGDKLD